MLPKFLHNRPFHSVFQLLKWTSSGKSIHTTEKSALNFFKSAKFESDLLKTNEYTAPQSREILQTYVWWGHRLAPNHFIYFILFARQ